MAHAFRAVLPGLRRPAFILVGAILMAGGLAAAVPSTASAATPVGWSGPAATGLASVNAQNSLFCLSASTCLADSYFSAALNGAQIAAYNGSSWSVTYTDTSYRCSGCVGPQLTGVQCLWASLCHALDNQGDFLTYDGTNWTSVFVNSDLFWGSLASVTLIGNTGGIDLTGNHIRGPVTLRNNIGLAEIASNTIAGTLSCTGNNPQPANDGNPNTVTGPESGQCAGL